jgi:DNA helicase-2/ATP-dependent DNA helicase PcrA
VVNFPPRGIGARSIEQLQDAARARGGSLNDAAADTTGRAGANLGAFIGKIASLRERTRDLTLREIIVLVLQESGLIEHYKAEREGADRIENLEELVNAAESFVTQEGFGRDAIALPVDELAAGALTQSPASQGLDPSLPVLNEPAPDYVAPDAETGETLSPLAAFLTHAALESGDNQAQAGQDAVQLMTVHSAKGLEFDCVFISGLEEGLFPSERSLAEHEGLEEERRLMYVAITRARKRLYLSHSQTRLLHGQTRYNVRTRFFDELPENTLKWLTPKNQRFSGSAFGFGGGYPTTSRGNYGNTFEKDRFASPPVPQQKAAPAHGLAAGMKVFHTKFGEGKVVSLEGQGDDARAQVSFTRHGVKWLALSVAKLTPVP